MEKNCFLSENECLNGLCKHPVIELSTLCIFESYLTSVIDVACHEVIEGLLHSR